MNILCKTVALLTIVHSVYALTPAPRDIYVGTGSFSAPYYDFYADSDGNQPVDISDLVFIEGATYTFTRIQNGHPFYLSDTSIMTDDNGGSGLSLSQSLTITIPEDYAGGLEYYCTAHAGSMRADINVYLAAPETIYVCYGFFSAPFYNFFADVDETTLLPIDRLCFFEEHTYTFERTQGGHPFYLTDTTIMDDTNGGSGIVAGQSLTITIPNAYASTVAYYCTAHSTMEADLSTTAFPFSSFLVDVSPSNVSYSNTVAALTMSLEYTSVLTNSAWVSWAESEHITTEVEGTIELPSALSAEESLFFRSRISKY